MTGFFAGSFGVGLALGNASLCLFLRRYLGFVGCLIEFNELRGEFD
jgi:hypothetical protein